MRSQRINSLNTKVSKDPNPQRRQLTVNKVLLILQEQKNLNKDRKFQRKPGPNPKIRTNFQNKLKISNENTYLPSIKKKEQQNESKLIGRIIKSFSKSFQQQHKKEVYIKKTDQYYQSRVQSKPICDFPRDVKNMPISRFKEEDQQKKDKQKSQETKEHKYNQDKRKRPLLIPKISTKQEVQTKLRQTQVKEKITEKEQNPIEQIIIDQRYNKQKHYLNLNQQAQNWWKVLNYMKQKTDSISNKPLQQLASLVLQQCQININNINYLVENSLPSLKQIWLWGNRITDDCVKVIFQRQWKALKRLRLSQNQISDQGLMYFQVNKYQHLENLCLANNKNITMKGIQKILNLEINQRLYDPNLNCYPENIELINLRFLNISRSLVGNSGVKMLVKAKFEHLNELYLQNCNIGSEGARHLSKGNWPQLKNLLLSKNLIEGVDTMLAFSSSNWKKMEKLKETNIQHMSSGIRYFNLVLAEWQQTNIEVEIQNMELRQKTKEILKKKLQFY